MFNRLPKLIVDNQTLNVDAVSGATISSHGVIDGVAEAITEAGGDAEEWKKRAKPSKAHATKDEEYTTDVVVIGAGGAGLADRLYCQSTGEIPGETAAHCAEAQFLCGDLRCDPADRARMLLWDHCVVL